MNWGFSFYPRQESREWPMSEVRICTAPREASPQPSSRCAEEVTEARQIHLKLGDCTKRWVLKDPWTSFIYTKLVLLSSHQKTGNE